MTGVVAGVAPVIRIYKGTLTQASKKFQEDARLMASNGWHPLTQVYEKGSLGCATLLIFLTLFVLILISPVLFVIGIVTIIALLILFPQGRLVVTYQYRQMP